MGEWETRVGHPMGTWSSVLLVMGGECRTCLSYPPLGAREWGYLSPETVSRDLEEAPTGSYCLCSLHQPLAPAERAQGSERAPR